MSGAPDDARSHQADALNLLRKIGIRKAFGECLCGWGHLKLQAGERADEELAEARSIAQDLSSASNTGLDKTVARLDRSVEAHGRGNCILDAVWGIFRRGYSRRLSRVPDVILVLIESHFHF